MLLDDGKPQTHQDFWVLRRYPDDLIAETVSSLGNRPGFASAEAENGFGLAVRQWAVMVLDMLRRKEGNRQCTIRETKRSNDKGKVRPRGKREPKEETKARAALIDLAHKLAAAENATLALPMLAREALRDAFVACAYDSILEKSQRIDGILEAWGAPERLQGELSEATPRVREASERIEVREGAGTKSAALNRALNLLMDLCEHATEQRVPTSKSNWFIEVAGRIVEPLFPDIGTDANGLDSRIARLARARLKAAKNP